MIRPAFAIKDDIPVNPAIAAAVEVIDDIVRIPFSRIPCIEDG